MKDLRYSKFLGSDLQDANFTGADLRDTTVLTHNNGALVRANMARADLFNANLEGVNWSDNGVGPYMPGVRLERANLEGAKFMGADLSKTGDYRVNLRLANLKNANFSRSNMRNAFFYEANFTGTNMSYTDLRNSDLRKASVQPDRQGARDFTTNFEGANLEGAETDLTEEQRQKLISDIAHWTLLALEVFYF
jgi:uncharacterized protein YjbI with pentapeptide repeats